MRAIDEAALARALGDGSAGGTGGMASKLEAARLAWPRGRRRSSPTARSPGSWIACWPARTWAPSCARPSGGRRRLRHIAVSGRKQGALVVNDGALRALVERKASLLPIGVIGVEGEFDKGDVVEIRDGSGRVHGRGLVNYDADACRKLAGRHSDDIDTVLGYRGYDALVTRDNLVMGAL